MLPALAGPRRDTPAHTSSRDQENHPVGPPCGGCTNHRKRHCSVKSDDHRYPEVLARMRIEDEGNWTIGGRDECALVRRGILLVGFNHLVAVLGWNQRFGGG